MSDSRGKDSTFLKKVVKFVSNPNTEWGEIDEQAAAASPAAQDRSELQVMIERKRRNDFVRRQELDLLRQIRREGLTGEQIRAIEREQGADASSYLPTEQGALAASEVRRRIDGIEREMTYEDTEVNTRALSLPMPERHSTDQRPTGTMRATTPLGLDSGATRPDSMRRLGAQVTLPKVDLQFDTQPNPAALARERAAAAPAQARATPAAPRLDTAATAAASPRWHPVLELDAQADEVLHDPELDQAAIAFANADFGSCEKTLRALVGRGGSREQHIPTWRALLDLYRAIGQQQRFEWTAATYVKDLAQSPPTWVSIPRLAMSTQGRPETEPAAPAGTAGGRAGAARPSDAAASWSCPSFLDAQALAALRAFAVTHSGQAILIDWGPLQMLDGQGANTLRLLLRDWAAKPTKLQWTGVGALFDLLEIAAPPGDHLADPAFWQVRLEALRLLGDRSLYDLASEDYAATYGATPPDWQPAALAVGKPADEEPDILAAPPEFSVSTMPDELGSTATVQVELVGQLAGDVSATLVRALGEIGDAATVVVSCARLIRVDLMAAGELLNWVAERRAEGRLVRFVDVHRVVALFFCAMGLDDQANIQLRPM